MTCCRDSAGSKLEKDDFFLIFENNLNLRAHPAPTSSGKAVRGGCRVFERVTKFDKIDQIFLPFLRERVTKFYKSYKIF